MSHDALQSDPYFIALVYNFQASAMIGMGKMMNPFKNEITRNMDEAKHSIDMLEMLDKKTKGNLTDEENRMLQSTLTTLRLNYVDEVNKDKEAEQKKEEEKKETEPKAEEKKEKTEEKKTKEKTKTEKKPKAKKSSKKEKTDKK